ncbi:MAG: non-heme iron oxygenase ferredoxin subunit [Pusillimonas sp.]|nr:MAG: non-heme iron oxygenase ferredoxin subunit [Pusillimonas sp.]
MSWMRVADEGEIKEGEGYAATAGRRHIAIFKVKDSLYACDGICTHAHAYLAEGYVEGEQVECPMHAGRFNVRTGKALCAPARVDLNTFPVEIRAGGVFVDVPA